MLGSILGTRIEGAFCLIRHGRWETHTVALWGPFCIIYGIGAVILYVGAVLSESMPTVIQNYIGYIKYLSYFQGSINDNIQDYLKACLMEALPKFRFDR